MQNKETIILNAAVDIFLEKGYNNTSLKDIVNVVGGSYSTIYKKFNNKNNLFLQALKFRGDTRFEQFKVILDGIKDYPIDSFLSSFGIEYCRFFLGPDNIKFLKLVLERVYQDDETRQACMSIDKDVIIKWLQPIFEEKIDKSILNKISSDSLAILYCSMLSSHILFDLLFNLDEANYNEEFMQNHVNNVNYIFLKLINNP